MFTQVEKDYRLVSVIFADVRVLSHIITSNGEIRY